MLSDVTVTESMTCVLTTATVTTTIAAARISFQVTCRIRRATFSTWQAGLAGSAQIGSLSSMSRVVEADGELVHHVVVLMHQVVAVHHVLAPVRPEPHDQPDRLALPDVGDILGAEFLGERCSTVAAEDPEIDQVDVQRMEPAVRGVLELPDLGVAHAGVGQHRLVPGLDDVRPGLAVEIPEVGDVVVLQPDVADLRLPNSPDGSSPGCPGSVTGMVSPGAGSLVSKASPVTSNAMILFVSGSRGCSGCPGCAVRCAARPRKREKSMRISYRSAAPCRHGGPAAIAASGRRPWPPCTPASPGDSVGR